LTGADTVIFVEHNGNPMKYLQAMDWFVSFFFLLLADQHCLVPAVSHIVLLSGDFFLQCPLTSEEVDERLSIDHSWNLGKKDHGVCLACIERPLDRV
jgi:hypothetical protein